MKLGDELFHDLSLRSQVDIVLGSVILIYEFEIQSRYYVHFMTFTLGKDLKSLQTIKQPPSQIDHSKH